MGRFFWWVLYLLEKFLDISSYIEAETARTFEIVPSLTFLPLIQGLDFNTECTEGKTVNLPG